MLRFLCLLIVVIIPVREAFSALAVPTVPELKEAREDAREEADLVAQQEVALWTYWMLVATVCSCGVSMAALVGLLRSLRQTGRAIKDNREIGEAHGRAYVHPVSLTFGEDRTSLIVKCKNLGATPAATFAVGLEIKLVKFGEISENAVTRDYEMKTWSGLGTGEEEAKTCRCAPTNGSEYLAMYYLGQIPDQHCLLVCGKIIYSDVFRRYHETGFAYFAWRGNSFRWQRPVNSIPAYVPLSDGEASAKLSFSPPKPTA